MNDHKNPIGLYTDCLGDLKFEAMLDWCAAHGVKAVELGTGNFSAAPHCSLAGLLESRSARDDFQAAFARRGLQLSALNCSGNVLDPDTGRRNESQRVLRETIVLAAQLGLPTIVAMSGCPGEPGDLTHYPNWVTSYWQKEYLELLEWQWTEAIEPFWRELGAFAAERNVRVAIEMHPGQAAYNVRTLLRLRAAGGAAIGANLDPSHLIWQGMDSARVVLALGDLVYNVHAKDCRMNAHEVALNGVLETHLTTPHAWEHCLPGDGQAETFWRGLSDALTQTGYRGPLTIEYADDLADPRAGIQKAAAFLRQVQMAAAALR